MFDDFDYGFYPLLLGGTALSYVGVFRGDGLVWAAGLGMTLLSAPCSKVFWEVVGEERRKRRLRRQDQWHDADNPYRDW